MASTVAMLTATEKQHPTSQLDVALSLLFVAKSKPMVALHTFHIVPYLPCM